MELDFDKGAGLLPAIVQDAASGEVLMLAWMNLAALAKTLAGGYVTFFSRSRQTLWTKGETSGNRLRLMWLRTDCDGDTLLAGVQLEGDGLACHAGRRSCFWRAVGSDGGVAVIEAGQ